MTVNLDFGIEEKSKARKHLAAIKCLRPIIEQWGTNIRKYCSAVDDDVPYYYNERANLSLFASAAWQSGVIALEEYHTYKRHGRGRTDLFLWIGGKDGVQIEAKQKWIKGQIKDRVLQNRISEALGSAVSAAEMNANHGRN